MLTWMRRLALALVILLLLAVAGIWWLLRGSLPQLDGDLPLPGLSAPASIQRDKLGVVTIEAASEADAMRALGYVHAQERYFEMDLMRRTAAGELAALFGERALTTDIGHRMHRFRERVTRDLHTIAGDKLPVLQAYVEGVNAGLGDLDVRPWPYLLLRTQPEPWRLEDSVLVGYAMYFDLQDGGNARELALSKIKPVVPAALFVLLTHDGSSWDAPLVGAARGDAMLPSADQLDMRTLPAPRADIEALQVKPELGSNNFAVSGALTEDGRAIVANDMHLALRAPSIWFRAQFRYADARAPDGRVDAGGFTLPGLPLVVVGSNGHVAWGFTNSYGDWLDWQLVPPCPTPACAGITTHRERIEVAGGKAFTLLVDETAWGPVFRHPPDRTPRALRWVAHQPGSVNLEWLDVARAASFDQALAVADRSAIPGQNLVIGARDGRIGWRLLGPLPTRAAACSATTVGNTNEDGCPPWSFRTDDAPRVIDPQSHRLWTANSRVVDGIALARLGDGGYVNGARGRQIRDRLFAKQRFDERDLLAIQLDDHALFLHRWWQLLRAEATRTRTPALRALAGAADTWPGRASTDAVSHRLVRAWRLAVHARIADGLVAPAKVALGESFTMPALPQLEGVAWPLVTQRPQHLLPRRFATWDALFEDAAKEVRDGLAKLGPLAERTWGEQNTARICHPLAGALPSFAKHALCMPFEPLPGDTAMPRVQSPDMGASERMVVSPGHEADGIIHMPGGQSGHPLSPFWGAGHDDWVHGRATPFLPGPQAHILRMAPASE
jgi:penicillin G amidase